MFAEPGIADKLAEKIVAFVDREAGREAPLSAADEALVRDLLDHDPVAQKLADDLRATNAGLDTLLDDVADIEVPEKLVALIRSHAASDVLIAEPSGKAASRPDGENEADVVELRQPQRAGFGYGALAAAASIALFVSCGALLHLYTTFQDDRLRLEAALTAASNSAKAQERELAQASADVERLAAITERNAGDNEQATHQLTESEGALQQLEIEQAALQRRYDELLGENQRLTDLTAERATDVAGVRNEQLIADLSNIRQALEAEHLEMGKVRGIRSPQTDDVPDDLTNPQQRLLALTEQLETTLRQATADGEVGAATDTGWLGQISHSHRIYASTARRHLVEVGADELAHIEQWLGTMLGRPIPVPDLSSFGTTFKGARLLAIDEKPVAQLVYLDADDRPLTLCIIASTEDVKAPAFSNHQDLNLVDWRDGRHGYAVVGWSDPAILASLAQTILPVYDF